MVKEPSILFAPLRERYDSEWSVVEQKEVVFTNAMSEVLECEALVGNLDDAEAQDARAAFHLIRRN